MFRHSALLFVALLCVADAQFDALTANKTKTGNKLPKGAHKGQTKLRKVTGFNLCTQSYEAYIGGAGVAGTGAFSYPVYPGDCDEVDSNTEQIGSLSAMCSGNPYEGETFTLTLVATTDTLYSPNPLDTVTTGCNNGAGAETCPPVPAPQFFLSNLSDPFAVDALDYVVAPGTDPDSVQAQVNDLCGDKIELYGKVSKLSQCSAQLRLSGDNRKNKHPGSTLSFDYMTNTTLVPAGSTYTTITQYGLTGTGATNSAFNPGGGSVYAAFSYLTQVELFAYTMIDSITCVARPNTIDTTFSKIYDGSGRFAKYPASKVASVNQMTELVDGPPDAANPFNPFEFAPLEWETLLEVNYAKHYLHSSML